MTAILPNPPGSAKRACGYPCLAAMLAAVGGELSHTRIERLVRRARLRNSAGMAPSLGAAHDWRSALFENTFSECEPAIAAADLDRLESVVGKTLPASFRDHYLKYNGGTPERAYWVDESACYEPSEVAAFKPIAHSDHTLLSTYQSMLKQRVLPARLLPFANDWGGNFFCLDLETGTVSYFTVDAFDSDLGPEENQKESERHVCSDFRRFVQGLVAEDELDER